MAINSLSSKPVSQPSLFLSRSPSISKTLECFLRLQTRKSWFPPVRICSDVGIRREGSVCRSLRAEEGNCKEKDGGFVELEPIRTLILDNYDSYTYNLFQLLSVINGVAPVVLKNDEITFDQLWSLLYEERAFHNVVISPGPGSPTCANDIGISMRLLQECTDIPILGVCLGHQALGCAHGAEIVHAPEPVHGRLSEVEHNGHPLFNKIPSGSGSGFKVVRYHSLMIDAASMPADLIPTAWTVPSDAPSVSCSNGVSPSSLLNGSSSRLQRLPDKEAEMVMHLEGNALVWRRQGSLPDLVMNGSNGQPWMAELPTVGNIRKQQEPVVMAMSHRTRPHHGVQFHPESVATAHGKQILENFCKVTREYWQQQPWQPANKVAESPWKPTVPASLLQSTVASGFIADEDEIENSLLRVVSNRRASPHELHVHWQKLPGHAGWAGGSENIFCDLFGNGAAEDTFWLDSSTVEQGGARFSYMGGRGGLLWRRLTFSLGDTGAGGVVRIEDEAGQIEQRYLEEGFFNFLNQELESRSCTEADIADLPFDFCGGFVGYLGYELKVECGVRSNRHKSSVPDAALFLADRAVVIDHTNEDVYVLAVYQTSSSSYDKVATLSPATTSIEGPTLDQSESAPSVLRPDSGNGCNGLLSSTKRDSSYCSGSVNGNHSYDGNCLLRTKLEYGESAAVAWVTTTLNRISALGKRAVDLASERRHSSRSTSSIDYRKDIFTPLFTLGKSRTTYINDVNECKRYIRDGESYEVCLTTQLQRDTKDLDTLGLYLTLRKENPAPYASWLHFGKNCPQICCSSPERFLRLDRDGTLEAKPIKGTLPRGNSPLEDERLRYELQHSEKDYAENLMIVDLLRNDLGRVSVPGSVHVPSLMAVESYTTVHTLVSTVRGEKRDDVTPIECIQAAFPGGSMTGAPKLRTMEILDTIESGPRGVYSGTVGFLSFNKAFDLNIVIRTLVFSDGGVCIGAGGAVTALSDPDAEYEEMLLKTRGPIQAMARFEGEYIAANNQGQQAKVNISPAMLL